MTFNKVIQVGNLTRDPEVVSLKDKFLTKMCIAVNGQKDEVLFLDIECWGKLAELCAKYLTKGREILVEGRLRQDTWEKDGQKRSKLTVVASDIHFGHKNDGVKVEVENDEEGNISL